MKPDIEAIRARAEKATAGPWVLASVDIMPEDRDAKGVGRLWTITEPQEGQTIRRGPIGRKSPNTDAVIDGAGYDADGIYGSTPDLDFIAHAREDIPALLARVDELERVVEAAGIVVLGQIRGFAAYTIDGDKLEALGDALSAAGMEK